MEEERELRLPDGEAVRVTEPANPELLTGFGKGAYLNVASPPPPTSFHFFGEDAAEVVAFVVGDDGKHRVRVGKGLSYDEAARGFLEALERCGMKIELPEGVSDV